LDKVITIVQTSRKTYANLALLGVKKKGYECAVCKKAFGQTDVVSAHLVREPVYELIRRDYPNWSDKNYICRSDLSVYRAKYVHSLLESEKGELSELEKEVLDSLQKHELISSNVDNEFECDWTFGEKLADRIAVFGGSWRFLIIFALFLKFLDSDEHYSVVLAPC
jgi:hypothetical protein